jgi:DNA ligase-associated metallophosphoesterase
MQQPLLHTIQDNSFWLTADRSLFWEEENTLIIADMHLGKTGHFRKSGIAVPQSVYQADLQRLMAQLYFFKADRLIIVGDLTHSSANKELDLFKKWRQDFSLLQIELVKGNHDILNSKWYEEMNITVIPGEFKKGYFNFCHDFEECGINEGHYTFSGHVHPGISMKGQGRQSLHFPCFYFASTYCILPAFSRFTGTYKVRPQKGETVYAIVENRLMEIP